MKNFKTIFVTLLAFIAVISVCSCEAQEKESEKKIETDRFIILHSEMPQDRQIASSVASALINDGRSVTLKEEISAEENEFEKFKAVITVGRSETQAFLEKSTDVQHIYCITDGGVAPDTDKKGIAPTVESSGLADAAMILIPDAEDFSIVSGVEGASDVQDACDLLDRTGMGYTVESLEGRIYSEVLLSCLESDTDALLLPSGALGHKSSSAYTLPYIPESYVPVIAVGIGEPLRGALATFCIDSEIMSEALYSLINSEVYGNEAVYPDNYYVLCINKERAADIDERAKKNIAELFPVVWIE